MKQRNCVVAVDKYTSDFPECTNIQSMMSGSYSPVWSDLLSGKIRLNFVFKG